MLDKILRLGKEAAIYGLSSIVGRFLNFLLVPFYTNVLLPSEYGIIANLYAYIAFATIIYGYGMDAAFMRFWASMEIGDKKQNFSTPLISLVVTSLVLSLMLSWYSPAVAGWIGMAGEHTILVRYTAWILFFDTLAHIPFSYLRMENKAGTFATIRIANIVFTILLNILLILGFHMKAEGVVLANLIASVITFLIHLRSIISHFTLSFSRPLYRELLKFGIPYVPAGLAGIAMQVIDRPILKALTNDATVGIYQASYRLGIFMMLVVGMFDYAWRPFFLKHADEPDAKQLFARVFTYFLLVAAFVFVVLTLFVEDLIRVKIGTIYFIHPDYWAGVVIVPTILLAYVFNGAYANFVVGVYLKKKTLALPYVFGAGALVNVSANYLLIPILGIMGAAYATLLSYAVLAVGMYFASQRLFRIEYEWLKVITVLAVVTLVVSLFNLSSLEPGTWEGLLAKSALVTGFVILLFFGRVVEPNEVKEVGSLLRQFVEGRKLRG